MTLAELGMAFWHDLAAPVIAGILAGDEEQTGVTQDSATAADTAAQTDTQTTDAGTDTADTQSADGTADTQAADGTAGEGESGQ